MTSMYGQEFDNLCDEMWHRLDLAVDEDVRSMGDNKPWHNAESREEYYKEQRFLKLCGIVQQIKEDSND